MRANPHGLTHKNFFTNPEATNNQLYALYWHNNCQACRQGEELVLRCSPWCWSCSSFSLPHSAPLTTERRFRQTKQTNYSKQHSAVKNSVAANWVTLHWGHIPSQCSSLSHSHRNYWLLVHTFPCRLVVELCTTTRLSVCCAMNKAVTVENTLVVNDEVLLD